MITFPACIRFSETENLEIIDEVSMTEPNQSVTIKDLFERFDSGTLPNIAKPIQNGQDQTFDDVFPTNLDVFEAYEINAQYEQKLGEYLKQKEAEQRQQEEEKLYEQLKAKYAKSADVETTE